jgi:hypothetical protein
MTIRVYANGKFYLIECPDGSRVVRADLHDVLVFPFEGQPISIPSDPPELLPLLAESGRCGLSLVGEPVPDLSLAGVSCPNCQEDDVNWLSVADDSENAHCDNCGCDFDLGIRRF